MTRRHKKKTRPAAEQPAKREAVPAVVSAPRVSVEVWARLRALTQTRSAAFLAHTPWVLRTVVEWDALYSKFLQTPVTR